MQSRASLPVLVITTIAIIVGTVIPYTPLGAGLGMAALPAIYFAWLAGIIFAYMVVMTNTGRDALLWINGTLGVRIK